MRIHVSPHGETTNLDSDRSLPVSRKGKEIPMGTPSRPSTESHDDTGDTIGFTLGQFRQSVTALEESCAILEKRSSRLDWALRDANEDLRRSLRDRDRLASRLDSILRCLQVGVIAVDLDGIIIEFNESAAEISGRTRQEVIGRPYSEIVGLAGPTRQGPLFTLETGTAIRNEERTIGTPSSDRLPVGYSTSLIESKEGWPLGAVEVLTDLSDTRAITEELSRVRTTAALADLAVEMATQIRNPLSGVSGFSDLLLHDMQEDDPRRELAKKINQGVHAVESVVTRLLDGTGDYTPSPRAEDLPRLIEKLLDRFESSSRNEPSIRIHRDFGIGPLMVKMIPDQLSEAFRQLLLNGVEAMPNGGDLTVRIERVPADGNARPMVNVLISDVGMGMTDDVAGKALSPFFTSKVNRPGLGLTTTERIVTGHGGELHLSRRAEGGTTARVQLPRELA